MIALWEGGDATESATHNERACKEIPASAGMTNQNDDSEFRGNDETNQNDNSVFRGNRTFLQAPFLLPTSYFLLPTSH